MLQLAIKAERKIKGGQTNATSSTTEDQPLLVCHTSIAKFRAYGTTPIRWAWLVKELAILVCHSADFARSLTSVRCRLCQHPTKSCWHWENAFVMKVWAHTLTDVGKLKFVLSALNGWAQKVKEERYCVWYWIWCHRRVLALTAFIVQVQTYFHHPTYGQIRSLPDAVRVGKRHHSSSASESAVTANPAPISASTEQDTTKPEYAGFGCAKAFFMVLAYI